MSAEPGVDSSDIKPRLLIVSATYSTEENRKRLVALSRYFEVTCATCAEITQYGLYNRIDPAHPPAEYRLIGLPFFGSPATTTRYLLRGLGKVFRDHPADIVLVESEPWAWLRWHAWLCKTLYCPRAIFGEYSAENLERPGWKGFILDLAYRAAVATADFVIICNTVGGEFYRRRGLPAESLLVCPQLGVDETLFHPVDGATRARLRREAGLPPEGLLIGFCGRLVESKGVRDLVRALRAARHRAPDLSVHLAVLGAGPLKDWLATEEGVGDYLHVLPARMHAEVAPYMQMLDIFVLPSKASPPPEAWVEQFGYVLIQAMACAVPTLGSDSGAIPEVINFPEMIFPAGDVAALTEKLLGLLQNPAWRERAARQQRQQALARYSNENLGAQTARFISSQIPVGNTTPTPIET